VNRAVRAAALGVLLFCPVALTACSAGQVTQTVSQERDKTGPMAQVGDITLRQIQLAYPNSGRYQTGEDAELQMAIVNSGTQDDALVGVTGDGFQSVRVTGGGTAEGAGGTSASPAAPTGSTGSTGSTGMKPVVVPAQSALYLGVEGPTVTLAHLTQPLTTGQTITLTLTFEKAGQVTVVAAVATPNRPLPRGQSYDFHQTED
jgi:copper(I)-binding protein